MAPRIRYPVPDLNERSKPRYQIEPSRDPSDIQWDRRIKDFAAKFIRFESDVRDDAAWQFQRNLGKGHFGIVGLWVKRDEEGASIDKLAIKELAMPQTDMYLIGDSGRRVPEEAIIQVALQKKNCVPVVQMRGLSVVVAEEFAQAWEERMRYYLEYCPHGDLGSVVEKYIKLYNEDRDFSEHVPEAFLWQLLYNFAQAMVAMESPPFDHPNAQSFGPNSYILHLDIKTRNIMLAEPDDEDIIPGYPSSKIGDWGLANLTNTEDFRNSTIWRGKGTPGWYPPEQIFRNTFGQDWKQPPPWRTSSRPDGRGPDEYAYTSAHSVFAFASVIFMLMVLDDRLEHLLNDAVDDEDTVRRYDFEYVTSGDMDTNYYGCNTPYSDLMKKTIAECLRIDPASRPLPAQLLQVTREVCERIARTRRQYQTVFPTLHTMNAVVEAEAAASMAGYNW